MPPKVGLPDAVRILAYDIAILAPDPIEMDHNEVEGRFLLTGQRIEIRTDRPNDMIRDTLLHEVLHAILACSGVRTVLDLDHHDEERLVSGLSPVLLAVLRDNPAFTKFLLGT